MSDEPLPPEVEVLALAVLGKRVKEQENLSRAVIAGNYGPAAPTRMGTAAPSSCQVDQCSKQHHAQGYCRPHYLQLYKAGRVSLTVPWVPIPSPKPIEPIFGSPRLPLRFWAKVTVTPHGCWEWTAARVPAGYGHFGVAGRTWRAHRLVYTVFVGPIPPRMDLDHYRWPDDGCVGPACVLHTRLASSWENTLRGGNAAAWNKAKTHCSNGHEFAPANVWLNKRGARCCRACNRDNQRRRAAARSRRTSA